MSDASVLQRDTCVRVSESVYAREFGPELVLLDFARGEYFGLDEVGGEVWRLLERGCSLGAIADALVGQFDVSADRALHDVVALVTALRDASLVSVFDG